MKDGRRILSWAACTGVSCARVRTDAAAIAAASPTLCVVAVIAGGLVLLVVLLLAGTGPFTANVERLLRARRGARPRTAPARPRARSKRSASGRGRHGPGTRE